MEKEGGMKSRAMEIFREAANSLLNPEMQKWREQGGKILGYMCSSVPDEMITAAGLIPFRIRGTGSTGTELADAYMSPLCCGFTRHTWNTVLEGKYDFLEGLIGVPSCDHSRRFLSNLEHFAKFPFFFLLASPRLRGEEQVEWLRYELMKFKECMENHFGILVTDERLWEAIKLHNRKRRLQRKLYDLRKRERPSITGAETLAVMVAGTAMPKERYNQLLSELIDERSPLEGGGDYRARLLVEGSLLDNPAYIEVIEGEGGLVVTDYLCFGTREMWVDVDEGENDPITALSRYYVTDRISCPRVLMDQKRRSAIIMDMVRDFKVDGIVGLRMPYCDNWGLEEFMLGRDLAKEGIPHLRIDKEYTLSGVGQLRTRMQAFLEMIGGAK